MSESFAFDVFLSHSSRDKKIVRDVAERLKKDGIKVWFDEWILKPGDSIPAKIEEGLEQSRVLVLCMSENAFGSDWAKLESYTFRFRDPLNKERRFIPLRLDEFPIKGSLAQFLYINWLEKEREQAYPRLREACSPLARPAKSVGETDSFRSALLSLGHTGWVTSVAWSEDGKRVVSGSSDKTVRIWNVESGKCERVLEGHKDSVFSVGWSADGKRVVSGSNDKTVRIWNAESGKCERVLEGHQGWVSSVAWSEDGKRVVSGSNDKTVRIWNAESGTCERVLEGHINYVNNVGWSADGKRVVSGSSDQTVRIWNAESGKCERVLEGHMASVVSVGWSADGKRVVSGSFDKTVRIWNAESGKCERVLEGHTAIVRSVAWSADGSRVVSGSNDKMVRIWDADSGTCERVLEGHKDSVFSVGWSMDGRIAFSCAEKGVVRFWEIDEKEQDKSISSTTSASKLAEDQVQYTNAKVLLVGDTSSGKTGLAYKLATGKWKSTEGSTVGAWSTQWQITDVSGGNGVEQEIWLWDFGGQADQRLVHQLYMDRAALILLLFDADKENVLSGLREWQTALRRCVAPSTQQFLVAGRIDAGFKASRSKLQSFANENHFRYFETSAKENIGCDDLIHEIKKSIPWGDIEKRTSPRIFKLIKDQILKLRDAGQVVYTFKELRDEIWQQLPEEPRFSDETLRTVIGLLDGPSVVKELDYGTYVLLKPDWVNTYAQAVIRTLRQDPSELGSLPLRSIAEGKLLFQTFDRDGSVVNMKRLPETEERVVLQEMEKQLEERGLCLRQAGKLVFPSHCGRERPSIVAHPSVFISYTVQGYLDDIYATLVVKLADSESFKIKELWRDAADFKTLNGQHHMGIKLTREAADSGDISVYFSQGVTEQEKVIFANYIHNHLKVKCEQVQRLRHYVCPECNTPKGNPEVLMKKLLANKCNADTECDNCTTRFSLWDDLEKLFASDDIRKQVEGLLDNDAIRLDSRRKGKLLALEVESRITSANQKCFEIPATEDEGIDMELEFTDDDGKGTGQRLYLQLKSGNAHLRKLKNGNEVFDIKEQRWVEYWMKQPFPVMLVIGTLPEDNERFAGKEKIEFSGVRWMEIREYLKRESDNGKKQVKHIVFNGERLDMASVMKLRNNMLSKSS